MGLLLNMLVSHRLCHYNAMFSNDLLQHMTGTFQIDLFSLFYHPGGETALILALIGSILRVYESRQLLT